MSYQQSRSLVEAVRFPYSYVSSSAAPGYQASGFHHYRLCFGLAAGDPALDAFEKRLAERPKISVPAITLDGLRDPLKPGGAANHAAMFTARHEHRVVDCGHNLPWEGPRGFC